MEQLTWKSVIDGHEDVGLKDGVSVGDAILKLVSYEDTGLSPETVSDLLDRFNYFRRTIEGLDLVDHVHFGAFVDRVKRWAQAEKDGRLVVLPCKVGDTVYIIRDRKIIITTVETIHQWNSGMWKLNVHTDKKYQHWAGYEVSFDNFGETAFLTREEAEAALKKRDGEIPDG